MTYEQFVNDLTYYCRTVLNEMYQMVGVADPVAQQEVDRGYLAVFCFTEL